MQRLLTKPRRGERQELRGRSRHWTGRSGGIVYGRWRTSEDELHALLNQCTGSLAGFSEKDRYVIEVVLRVLEDESAVLVA